MNTHWGPEFVTDPTAEVKVPIDDATGEDQDPIAQPPTEAMEADRGLR